MSGVTTIRTVGGLGDFDTRLRDEIKAGKTGPRILAANQGISVPGGHMAGSVAVAAKNNEEALAHLVQAEKEKVDLVKLMITGGVLDAKEKGVPGELKMPPEMVKAVCDKAHEAGFIVSAHVESPQGVKVALQNGVDSIEHGAKLDDEMIALFKERGAFLCTTISPALPYALFDRSVTNASEVEQYNGNVVFEGIVECAKQALANDIPVVLGNDVGCPWITQYDFWRELYYFHKYVGVSNAFALYTATARSAAIHAFFIFARNKAVIAAKDAAVCPDGKEKSRGFFMRMAIAVLTSYGLTLATRFFKIRLHKIRSIRSAAATIIPVFLVFGSISKTTASTIQIIPALPRLVINANILSSSGVCMVCKKSRNRSSMSTPSLLWYGLYVISLRLQDSTPFSSALSFYHFEASLDIFYVLIKNFIWIILQDFMHSSVES